MHRFSGHKFAEHLRAGGYMAIGVEVVGPDHTERLDGVLDGDSRVQSSSQLAEVFPSLELIARFDPSGAGDAVFTLRKPTGAVGC